MKQLQVGDYVQFMLDGRFMLRLVQIVGIEHNSYQFRGAILGQYIDTYAGWKRKSFTDPIKITEKQFEEYCRNMILSGRT